MPAEDDVLRLAEAVSNEQRVDWERELRAGGTPSHIIEGLKLIENVRDSHLRLQRESEELSETLPTAVVARAVVRDPEPPPSGAGVPLIGSRWGRLELRARLGEGSFGEIYRAFDPALQSEVALKLLKPDDSGDRRSEERFLGEARTLAKIRHPNVLVVHGADRHEGRVGLWTELIRGETLEEQLQSRGRLGAREAALVGIELCHALAAVHAQGLVHRDVKTSNVMREQGGRIVLMDFGITALATPDASGGTVYGTPLAMAPEQLRGGPVGPAADLYAVGVLLYRLVSGHPPIDASSFAELALKHSTGERVPLRDRRPELPAEFVQVVERCLESDPAKRYASAGALEAALATSVGIPTGAVAPPPRRSWRPLIYAASAMVLALVVWTLMHPKPHPGGLSAVVPPPSPRALTATAVLYRVGAAGREVLPPGARVAPGTRLAMEFESPESTYVYVIDEDDEGRSYLLFPVPGLAPANPLPPGGPASLPGRLGGHALTWQVSSTGGSEHLLTVASRRPLAEIDAQLAALPAVRAGHAFEYPRVNARAMGELRGIGQLAADPDTSNAHVIARIGDVLASRSASAGGRDVWMWQTVLANPAGH